MGNQENVIAAQKNNSTWIWIVLGVGGGCGLLFIVLVGAVLSPAFSQARTKAKQISCMSNMRNLGVSMSMYLQDNDDKYPQADNWTERTFAYYKNREVTRCPSISTADNGKYGYAYNDTVAGMNVNKIKNPANGMLLYDSSDLQKDAHDAATSLPVPGRHNSGNNIAFQDGHIKQIFSSESAGGK